MEHEEYYPVLLVKNDKELMILRRLGNKKKLAHHIQQYFPPHKLYIEPFFGAGGMFFNKPKAKHNIVNDQDGEVFNLFMVVKNQPDALIDAWMSMPLHHDLWKWWKDHHEQDPVWRAVRFLFYSNYGFMGMPQTMLFNHGNSKQIVMDGIKKTQEFLCYVEFMNCDFRQMFKMLSLSDEKECLIYCDPPYLDTTDNYESSFKHSDSDELFDVLMGTGKPWCMSEFDHPHIIDNARKHGCEVVILGERHNIGNRRTEILVMNYRRPQLSLFF